MKDFFEVVSSQELIKLDINGSDLTVVTVETLESTIKATLWTGTIDNRYDVQSAKIGAEEEYTAPQGVDLSNKLNEWLNPCT